MSSFLTKKRTYEGYFNRISNEPDSTQHNKKMSIQNLEKFVTENYDDKILNDIIEELLIIKKEDDLEFENTLYDILQEWINWNAGAGKKSSTTRTMFSNLRGYMYYRGIKTDQQDIKENLKFGKMVVEEKHPMTQEEYRSIINAYSRNPRRQALYLTLGSSGMRVGEALRIKKKDLDFSHSRIKITIPAEITKTRKGRTTYISKEAETKLKPILDKLNPDDYMFNFGKKRTDRDRVVANECKTFSETLDRLGLDARYSSNNFRKITSHSCRAYFFTNACRIHGENYAHRMTGHSGYLMQYDRMTEEEKLKMYLELEPHLVIFDQTKNELEIERLKKENETIVDLREEVRKLREQQAEQDMKILDKLRKEGFVPKINDE